MYTHIAWVHRKWLDRAFWAEIRQRVAYLEARQQAKDIREARKNAA